MIQNHTHFHDMGDAINTSDHPQTRFGKKISCFAMAFIMLLLSLASTSCSDNSKKEFNSLIVKLAETDMTIDSNDWQQIVKFLDDHKAKMRDFFKDGQIDNQVVMDYITKFLRERRKPIEVQFVGIGKAKPYIAINFYLERSGSMTPYDAPDCTGEFKSAIVKLLNSVPDASGDSTIYVVNNEVHAYPGSIKEFISSKDIFEATKGYGDASYTNFGLIFDTIMTHNKPGEISILVTDLIYSPGNEGVSNPQRVFTEAEGMVNHVFKDQVKSKALLVLKMTSSYSGPYYPYNSQKGGVEYHGNRPYYILIVGNYNDIDRLSKEEKYNTFCDFKSIKGFEKMYLFDASDVYKPFFSLLLMSKDKRGQFRSA